MKHGRVSLWYRFPLLVAFAALALPVGAGEILLDRPENLDIHDLFTDTGGDPAGNGAQADIDGEERLFTTTTSVYTYVSYRTGEDNMKAQAFATAPTTGGGADVLLLIMRDPDLVKRGNGRLKLGMKSHVAVLLANYPGGFSPTTYYVGGGFGEVLAVGNPEKCKGTFSAKDADKNDDAESARWKVTCSRDAITALGLDPAAQAALDSILGVTGADQIKLTGRTDSDSNSDDVAE
jgi:hypothetical protein